MNKRLAWIFGIGFVLIGILGFVPSVLRGDLLFGVFAVDAMDNIIHLISGVLAIVAMRSGTQHLWLYFKVFGVVYTTIAIIGFLQGDTVLGLMVTNTADNLLHLAIAAVALWAGFGREHR